MTNIIVPYCVNTAEAGELTVTRDYITSSKRIQLSAWSIVVPVNRSCLNEDFRVQRFRFQAAEKSLLRRAWSEWIGYKRVSRQLTPSMGLLAEAASGTYSQDILSKLHRVQIRTKNYAAVQCALCAISLTKNFLHRLFANNGGC